MSLPRRVSANILQTSRRQLAFDRLPRLDIRARDEKSTCVYLRLNAGTTETTCASTPDVLRRVAWVCRRSWKRAPCILHVFIIALNSRDNASGRYRSRPVWRKPVTLPAFRAHRGQPSSLSAARQSPRRGPLPSETAVTLGRQGERVVQAGIPWCAVR